MTHADIRQTAVDAERHWHRQRMAAMVEQWRDIARNWRKGQMTREKRGDEVFAACADQLDALIQERSK
jgi:hypothetical protein